MNFYDVTAEGLSIEQCDHLALHNAGIVSGGFGYGYACPKKGPVNSDYESIVINKQGMGNHGSILLRGRTPRARGLIREGKILSITKQGIPWSVARHAVHMLYGMEIEVAQLATDLVETVRQIGEFSGDSHWQFSKWAGQWTEEIGMSFPRKYAASVIAACVAHS